MDVSIIIINYNTFILTCDCIRSVIEKTSCRYEIILVDNASQEQEANRIKEIFPDIILIKSQVNLGFAKGNNLGIKHATGKYILLLNSDTVLINNAIDLSLERMRLDGSIGVLSGQLLGVDNSLQHTSNQETTIAKNLSSSFKLHKFFKHYKYPPVELEKEHFTDWVWGTFMMMPRRVIDSLPDSKLHEDFFMYMEDRQWCYEIKKLGYTILYYPKAKIRHYISASSGLDDERKMKEKILPNEYRYFRLTRSNSYASLYCLTRGFLYITFFNREAARQALIYLRLGITQFFKNK